jgi:hypothetical protein
LVAQFDRKPFSFNAEINVPKGFSNKAFVKTFSGNLDWKASATYHIKNKFEIGLIYRRTNFKAAYNDATLNTGIKTKFIINGFGANFLYTYFDNAYFCAQIGTTAYYCEALYTKVTLNNLEITNPKLSFMAFEPVFNIMYKSSEFMDVGINISTTILSQAFNPTIPHLDEGGKVDYSNAKPTNSKTAFISFGFQLKWYLQFETDE